MLLGKGKTVFAVKLAFLYFARPKTTGPQFVPVAAALPETEPGAPNEGEGTKLPQRGCLSG